MCPPRRPKQAAPPMAMGLEGTGSPVLMPGRSTPTTDAGDPANFPSSPLLPAGAVEPPGLNPTDDEENLSALERLLRQQAERGYGPGYEMFY